MKLPEWLTGKRSPKRDFKEYLGELEVNLREVERLLAELERSRLVLEGGRQVYEAHLQEFEALMRAFLRKHAFFEYHRVYLRMIHFGPEHNEITTLTFCETETSNLENWRRYLQGCRRDWDLFLEEFSGTDLSYDMRHQDCYFDLLRAENHMFDMELWDRDFRNEQKSLEAIHSEIENYQRQYEQLLVFYEEKKREYEAFMRGIDEVEDVFHDALDRGVDEVEHVFHDAEAEF